MAFQPHPIEADDHIRRVRRTAALNRLVLGGLGIALILAQPELLEYPGLGVAGFVTVVLTSLIMLSTTRIGWLRFEESVAGFAAVAIIGMGDERITVLSVVWLVAVATGVMGRGGRVHWFGAALVLAALALPVLRLGHLSVEYATFCVAVVGLQVTSGRLTLELNRLLRSARLDAEGAETLLLAGDIAARVAHGAELTGGVRPPSPGPAWALSAAEEADAREALAQLLGGAGLMMAAQPIADLRSGEIHAYEALARFGRRRSDRSPQQWFALAEELGQRPDLERACLAAALELFAARPIGTWLSVNVSIPTVLDAATDELLGEAEAALGGLHGLVIEITEETLVENDFQVGAAIEALRERDVKVAIDDVGAGYSGLHQITTISPEYIKLDRSLVSGIDADEERAALVAALSGYAAQVGSLVVAEGVEYSAELSRLRQLQVPLAQGFYVATPGRPWPELSPDAAETLAQGRPKVLATLRI
jgi:EAL domain-containing protein (putative c-di-GMP-specific phosphodiesterase class I)